MNTSTTAARPIHPGEMLLEEFLKPEGLSQIALSKGTGIAASHINMIINGKAGVTADTAIRLGRFFSTSASLWLNLQNDYDVLVAMNDRGTELSKIKAYRPVAASESPAVKPAARVTTVRSSHHGAVVRKPRATSAAQKRAAVPAR